MVEHSVDGFEGPAAQDRRTIALGHLLIGLAGATLAAICLSVSPDGLAPLTILAVATWFSLRSLSNAADMAFDLAWEWTHGDEPPRRTTRTDRAVLGLMLFVRDHVDPGPTGDHAPPPALGARDPVPHIEVIELGDA